MDFRLCQFSAAIPIVLVLLLINPLVNSQLDYDYYEDSCPNLADIVRRGVWSAMQNETRIAASLLRLHFHDCIVDGCEGSVMLDPTPTMKGEKNAAPNNNSLRGFEVIDMIKAEVEEDCPSVVSCTDILTLAAAEAVFLSGVPYWKVPLGRRDGTTASEDAANNQIPSPFEPLQNITKKFTSKGLSVKDVVLLSGAHTIGFAQCSTFKNRLFDFNRSGEPDPTLHSSLLTDLQSTCPNQDSSNSKLVALDSVTTEDFDNVYYQNLVNNSGLLQSDQALMGDSNTASMVVRYSQSSRMFEGDFAASMVRLAGVGVLTGDEGEVRNNCRVVNQQ